MKGERGRSRRIRGGGGEREDRKKVQTETKHAKSTPYN